MNEDVSTQCQIIDDHFGVFRKDCSSFEAKQTNKEGMKMMKTKKRGFISIVFAVLILSITILCAASAIAAEVKVYAFSSGHIDTTKAAITKDRGVGVPFSVPVGMFAIKHGKSWVLFDTGINPKAVVDPIGTWGEQLVAAFTPKLKAEDVLLEQLKNKLGLEPRDFKAVILSHAHCDHAGSIGVFKNTDIPIYLQKKEYDLIKKAREAGNVMAILPVDFTDFDNLNWKPIEGVFDLFNDESVVIFPAPGHTLGSQAVMVKANKGRTLILTGDALYTLENLTETIPAGFAMDAAQAMQSLYVFQLLKMMGAEIIPPHDPAYWKTLALAPKPF